MNIDIHVDASCLPRWRVGGFAVYVTDGKSEIRHKGMLGDVANPMVAEIHGIIHALNLVKRQVEGTYKTMTIYTDCVGAMVAIRKNRDTQLLCISLDKLRGEVVAKLGIQTLEYKHVKAHTDAKDYASKANDWCDQVARSQMRKMLRRTKKKYREKRKLSSVSGSCSN